MALPSEELRYRDRLYDDRELAQARAEGALLAVECPERFACVRLYCGFIGYSQSGHSLVGSLINAHPDAVIAHELDALHLLAEGFQREQLLAAILLRDHEFAALQRQWTGYDYTVPGTPQGRTLAPTVIGDKKGRGSTLRLLRDPGLLERLRELLGLPLRIIHVVRHPQDTIASMRSHAGEDELDGSLEHFSELVAANAEIRDGLVDGELLDARLEDLIADPRAAMRRICEFLELAPSDKYLESCAAVVFPRPNRPGEQVPWSPAQRERVGELIARHDFLSGYQLIG
ncbi:MAG TPA: sulfotransferase [Solirubrobacteraceae bacterium]|nr:sulfotransferase [Solirubrobacteraceae bacterium]